MKLTVFTANCVGNPTNALYPNKAEIHNKDDMMAVITRDHVCAEFKNYHRSIDDFVSSNVEVMDCDNDYSDNSNEWITPEKYEELFPNVSYIIVPSRNDGKVKGNKSARPRHHIYFPHQRITSANECTGIKTRLQEIAPFFDDNALDSARFIFGHTPSDIVWHEGNRSIVEYLDELDFAKYDGATQNITEGSRNTTMSHIAGRLIKRYGNTDDAYQLFLQKAEKCNPPLEDAELKSIWNSALKFGIKVSSQEGYISPEQYNAGFELKPDDFSDVGQAKVLAREYSESLRYSPSTGYLVYNGSFWEESDPLSQAVAQDLTTRQLAEAEIEIKKRLKEMEQNGAFAILAQMGAKKAMVAFNDVQAHSFEMYEDALNYKKYAIKRRDSKYISSALKEVRPMVGIAQNLLDENEFLLNAPSGTYDLRKGTSIIREHNAFDYITKQTSVDADTVGMNIWKAALNTFFCKDQSLIDYVQKIVGLSAIGKVYVEALIIAYGEGRNGKSSFWNVLARTLGNFSGHISADVLTVGCKRNVKPELAEAKGKRLLIAAELEEGMRLNTSNVKQLCSTDEIYAEKKYKAPFSYIPSHTLVLYTNHLPKVGAIDKGTWRRLIVIPFLAKIEGNNEVKNYADYLYENAGGAILTWIIEGAKKVIEDNYHIEPPQKVQDAIRKYKENNDWMSHFLAECCDVDEKYTAKSGEVYNSYRSYCTQVGDFIRSTADFYTALESNGFYRKKTRDCNLIIGLRLKSDFLE